MRFSTLHRAAVATFLAILLPQVITAQLFQQTFGSSTTVSDYVNATPSNGQWNAIATSGVNVVISINTGGSNNKLRYARTGGNSGNYARTANFSPTPGTLMYRFDLTLSGNSAATTTAALLQLGSGFSTANTAEAAGNVHNRIGLNITATAGEFQVRDVAGGTNSASFSGTQTVLWVTNNSGAAINYRAPDGTQEALADDRFDVWVGTTKVFNEGNAQTATQSLSNIKLVFNNGTGTFDFDNFLIDPVPPIVSASAATGAAPYSFVANWTALSGVTGYSLDVSTSPTFSSFVTGYNNLYIAGAGTTSHTVTGLSPLTTYYYRVRGTSSYSVGSFSGANSSTITTNTTAVPVYYSRATGNVNDPIWSDTPTGTAGAATWSSASDMVIQSGDAVTINANTTIKSLTVESGATLAIDANRFLKATAGTNTIQGTLNAADNSRLEITEGTSASLAITGTASFWDFTAGMTTGVTVTGNMDIRGTLQVDDGDLDVTGANVTLRSTASYTGRLGSIGTGASYSGDLKIERHIPAGATNWRLLGSPVENQQVVHWQDDFITAGYPGSQYPNFPGGAQPNWPSIRWYDETNTGPTDNDGLQGVSNQLQALNAGQGFAAWCGDNLFTTNAFTIDLGPEAPVVGPVTLPMSYTSTGNPTADGWNLVANPLPSPVDFSSISRGADVEDYITFYNPANGNTAVYDLSLNFGTNGATTTIQSMQGFFLKAIGSAVTTVIDESDKVADNGGGMFGGSFGEVPPALRLQLSNSANAWKDEAGIVFHAGAPGHDAQDVLKYSLSANGAPRISTLAGSQPVAINAYGTLSSDMAIPVVVQAGANGTHTITVSAQGEFGITCITLEDLVTGTITPMVDGASYSFNLTTTADPSAPRFIIRASAPALLYAEDATCSGTPNGQASIVAQGGPHDITWMNLAGETLLVQNGIANGVATLTGLGAGSYIVSVTTAGCGTITREFAIDAPFVLEATAAVTNATCADANDGSIDLLPLGGTAPYAFLWNDAAASTTEDLTAGPGTYSVTITDANGCTWTSSGLAIANDGPVAEMTAAPATALVNEPVQFLAADVDGSYFWSFGDGNSSTAQDPVHTYTFPGTYTVVLSVDNGLCADAVSADITVELSTGTAEAVVRTHRAWATPQGIVVEHAFGGQAAVQVELLDATGRLAFARRATAERMVLPADGLSNGLWFVRLTSGDSRYTLRVPLTR